MNSSSVLRRKFDSVYFFPSHSIGCLKSKINSIFIPYCSLNNQVKGLKGRLSLFNLNENKSLLKEAFFRGSQFFGRKLLFSLSELVNNYPLIEQIIPFYLESNEEPTKIVNRLDQWLHLFDIDKLKLLAEFSDDQISILTQVQDILKDDFMPNDLKDKVKTMGKIALTEAYYFIHQLIEIAISFTGLTEIGQEERGSYGGTAIMSRYEAESKLEFYVRLLATPSLIFGTVFAFCYSTFVSFVITVSLILTTLMAIPFYLRYLKPCPHHYSGLTNINSEIIESEDPPIFKRIELLIKIQNVFRSEKGVILTADTAVGKTTLVKALAELIVEKKVDFLPHAQVFACNGNQFKDRNLDFTSLTKTFKKHKKDFILFIDEIASFFSKKEANEVQLFGNPVNSLLTFKDTFPYMICATTTKEYEELIKDHAAFNRRFTRIKIKPLQKEEIEMILFNFLHFKAPNLTLETGVISYIIDKSSEFQKNTSQLDGSKALLQGAISKANFLSFEKLEQEITALSLQVNQQKNDFLHYRSRVKKEDLEKHKTDKKNLEEKIAELKKKQKQLTRLKAIENIRLKLEQANHYLAKKVTLENNSIKKKWLVNYLLQKILSKFVENQRLLFNLPVNINKQMIDVMISSL